MKHAYETMRDFFEYHWSGKKGVMDLAREPLSMKLVEKERVNVAKDTKNSLLQNQLIAGDNLNVLKFLKKDYTQKIKMIYLDPPYNTGSDRLAYKDTFISTASKNSKKDSKFKHIAWLNFMLPRLMLCYDLLSEDGAIFISIDDREVAHLKLLLDEIWGNENFINNFVWTTKKGAQGMHRGQGVVFNHEYIVVYAKNRKHFKFEGEKRTLNDGFSNPDNDKRGPWKRQYMQRIGQGLPIKTIIDPSTGKQYSFETPYSEKKMAQWIREGRIVFPLHSAKYPMKKEFLYEYKYDKQRVTFLGTFPTKSATERLNKMFDGLKVFPTPKPLELMRLLVSICVKKNDIVLDCFSGSGTLAQAVIEENENDDITRYFICVQNKEKIHPKSKVFQAGIKTIFDVCYLRIKKVLEGQRSYQSKEEQEKISYNHGMIVSNIENE